MSSAPHTSTDSPPPRRKIIDGGFIVLLAVTLLAAALVTAKYGGAHALATALGALGFIAVLLPKVGAGLFVAAAIPLLLPREKVSALIGQESGWRGLLLASAAGALLPGGPGMTFPLAAALFAAGADIGATLAFVTGWSLLSLNRTLIWELSFLDWHLVALRIALCLPAPLAVGLAARALTLRRRRAGP
ncbi:permease [Vannielia sp. SX4]|uniref:permease n=1 Tax=Vannielia sp. SX4 TaxID=3463852 RepID=UPI00405A3EC2